ncbi:MAG: hypothetical protein DHS20C16_02820 [Phycisphaerae bacterium]|nr:MAG: hypothetical protein DHS20C16_02820 [Phycisphaerae bacterium]
MIRLAASLQSIIISDGRTESFHARLLRPPRQESNRAVFLCRDTSTTMNKSHDQSDSNERAQRINCAISKFMFRVFIPVWTVFFVFILVLKIIRWFRGE